MNIIQVLVELDQTIRDAWQAADLSARLQEWWWVVTHPQLLDAPPNKEKV